MMAPEDVVSTSTAHNTAADRKIDKESVLAGAQRILDANIESKKKVKLSDKVTPQSLYHWNEIQVLSTTADAYLGVVFSHPSEYSYATAFQGPDGKDLKQDLAALWCRRTGQKERPVYLYTYAPGDPNEVDTALKIQELLNATDERRSKVSALQLIEKVRPV